METINGREFFGDNIEIFDLVFFVEIFWTTCIYACVECSM